MRFGPRLALGLIMSLGALTAAPAMAGEALAGSSDAYMAMRGGRQAGPISLAGRWRVLRMNGARLPIGVLVTMEFGPDGRVSGRGGCNSYTGTYTLTQTGLSFSHPAATMMACPPPRMEIEGRFFEALKSVTGFKRGARGALNLMAGNRAVLLLRRG